MAVGPWAQPAKLLLHGIVQLAQRSSPAAGLNARLVEAELAPDLLTLQVDSAKQVLQEARKLVQMGKAANGVRLHIARAKAL